MSQPRFALYYWPLPFRAQPIRYLLTAAGETWNEENDDPLVAIYQADIPDQPVPFMGPPVLADREIGLWVSQLPAIISYLGEVLDLMPGNPAQDALTRKVVSDCVDVLHALTLDCGAAMWTDASWTAFADGRLPRWLAIFEELGRRNGLESDAGTLLGTPQPGAADLACAALWNPIVDNLPTLEATLLEHAPNVLALSRRIGDTPAIRELRADQRARWGDVWCGGQIEASLRSALAAWQR
jgi:glutathione S-transferase